MLFCQRIFCALFLAITITSLGAQSSPELVIPTGHTRDIVRIVVSPGGGMLATASIDETVKVWETSSGRELYTFRPGHLVRDLAFSPDGRYLAVAAFTKIHLLETAEWTTVATYGSWSNHALVFHPRNNDLFFLTKKSSATYSDPWLLNKVSVPGGSSRQIATIPSEKDNIPQMDISPLGDRILVKLPDQDAYLFSTEGGNSSRAAGTRRFLPDGKLLLLNVMGKNAAFAKRKSMDDFPDWTLPISSSQVPQGDLVRGAGFDPSRGNLYWLNAQSKLSWGDYQTGKLVIRDMPDNTGSVLAVGPDGRMYLAGKQPYLVYVYRLSDLQQVSVIGEQLLPPTMLAGSTELTELSWGSSQPKSLKFRNREVLSEALPSGFVVGQLMYGNQGDKLLAAVNFKTGYDVFSYLTAGDVLKRFKSGWKDAIGIAPAKSADRLAVICKDGYLLMNTTAHKSVGKVGLQTGDAYFNEAAALSPDGKSLVLSVQRYTGNGQQTKGSVRLVEAESGSAIWENAVKLDGIVFSNDGRQVIGEAFEYFVKLDAANGHEISRIKLPNGRFPRSHAYNANTTLASYVHDNRAYLFDLSNGQETTLSVPGEVVPFERVCFFGDDFVAAAGREGVIRVFDATNGRYVLALVQYADSDDWAVLAPDGRFDASTGAMRKIYYRVGRDLVAVEQLFEGFFSPGLAAEILNRLPAPVLPPRYGLNQLLSPPSVSLTLQDGSRNLIVEDDIRETPRRQTNVASATLLVTGKAVSGSRIRSLRLYHNDKLLSDLSTRNLIVEDDEPESINPKSYQVRLLPGLNEFKAIAVNDQGTESQPAVLQLVYQPAAPATSNATSVPAISIEDPLSPVDESGVTLHLLTVGINEYASDSYNLNYAVADAEGILSAFNSASKLPATSVDRKTIRNATAKKSDILDALRAIATNADADDIFIFYFAGHGLIGGRHNSFHIVPHDAASKTIDLDNLGISATMLRNFSVNIAAQRQLFLLDACQSGGAIQEGVTAGSAEEKAVAQLARTTGTHWIAATQSQQLATEFDELGHGVFTYAILEALNSSEVAGRDQAVSVNELKSYLSRLVPQLSGQYGGGIQYPVSYGFGRDFLLIRSQ